MAAHERTGTRPVADEGVAGDPRPPGGTRHAGGPQRRQADLVGARRDRHRRQRLRVLGRGGEQDHRRDDPDPAAGDRPHAARARRRVRPHHPVELPGGDRQLEDRPRAGVREHRDREAGEPDAAHHAGDRRDPLRVRAPRGDAQRAAGPGLDHGDRAHRRSARREDLVHGLHRSGREGDADRGRAHRSRVAGTRRQVGQRGVRRHGSGHVRREVLVVGVRQRGPGLLRAVADVGGASRLRRVRRAVRGGDRRDRGGPAAR